MKMPVIVAGWLALSAMAQSEPRTTQSAASQGAIDAGRAVYTENCASCHGAEALRQQCYSPGRLT